MAPEPSERIARPVENHADPSRDGASLSLAHMRRGVAHETQPTKLLGGAEHPGDERLEFLLR